MAALFACTKCHSRHPFDALSEGEQLCQRCRNNYPTVKCTYCRAEFQQESKSSTTTICKKCAQLERIHGKPSPCEYCSILAAFIGKKCQRCSYSEKKYGQPHTCEQCKQKCAFDRTEESKKKVGGKVLCWLCTLAYKRAVAKALQKSSSKPPQKRSSLDARLEWFSADNSRGGSESRSNPPSESALGQSSNGGSKDKSTVPWLNSSNDSSTEKSSKEGSHHRHSHHHSSHHHHHNHRHHHHHDKSRHKHQHSKSKHQHSHRKSAEEEDSPPEKKAKTEVTSTPNGVSTPKSNLPALEAMSDHVIVITQLKEQVEAQKKQLAGKDQQLMDKDKKITELKAQMYEQDKDNRNRVQQLQKQHEDMAEELQAKVRELTKQVKVLSKGKKLPTMASPPTH